MEWTPEALAELEKVPSFVRSMAQRAVEKAAKEAKVDKVTPEIVLKTKEKYFSMGAKEAEGDKKITKIAVVRCDIVSEVCPGVGCYKAFNNRKLSFQDYDSDTQMVGFFTCGGCSGRRVSRLVGKLLNYGLDVVHLSSCMCMDEDDYPKCPFKMQIKKSIEGKGVKVIEGTHH